jgi:hypothetical protein
MTGYPACPWHRRDILPTGTEKAGAGDVFCEGEKNQNSGVPGDEIAARMPGICHELSAKKVPVQQDRIWVLQLFIAHYPICRSWD